MSRRNDPGTDRSTESRGPQESKVSLSAEFLWFVWAYKWAWIIPLVLIAALLTAFLYLTSQPSVEPFTYSIF